MIRAVNLSAVELFRAIDQIQRNHPVTSHDEASDESGDS